MTLHFNKPNQKDAEFVLISIIVLVAGLQILLSSFSNLSSWRGGGFGMYTDPHPITSRTVWLEGENSEIKCAVRIWPLDERLTIARKHDSNLRSTLRNLRDAAKRGVRFPAGANFDTLKDPLLKIDQYHGMLPFFPRTNRIIRVYEIRISKNWNTLELHLISERSL